MDGGWSILYYQSTQQISSPVYEFINSLDADAKSKVINSVNLLEGYGIRLGPPHVKKVTGADLWELRILGSDNIRIFYIAVPGKSFLLLHGFIKKKQKTERKEIKTATERLKKYRSRIAKT